MMNEDDPISDLWEEAAPQEQWWADQPLQMPEAPQPEQQMSQEQPVEEPQPADESEDDMAVEDAQPAQDESQLEDYAPQPEQDASLVDQEPVEPVPSEESPQDESTPEPQQYSESSMEFFAPMPMAMESQDATGGYEQDSTDESESFSEQQASPDVSSSDMAFSPSTNQGAGNQSQGRLSVEVNLANATGMADEISQQLTGQLLQLQDNLIDAADDAATMMAMRMDRYNR